MLLHMHDGSEFFLTKVFTGEQGWAELNSHIVPSDAIVSLVTEYVSVFLLFVHAYTELNKPAVKQSVRNEIEQKSSHGKFYSFV
jgi:hypothetical protein